MSFLFTKQFLPKAGETWYCGQVKTVAGQLLGPSFYQMAGLGLMILGLSTSFCKVLGLPSSDLTPFKVRAAICPWFGGF